MPHLKPEDMARLAESPASERPAHLLGCTRCAGELESLARLINTMCGDRSLDPPAASLACAHDLYLATPRPTLGERLRRWTARLVSDSAALIPAAAAARGAAGGTRQMLFSTETVDIDLAHPLAQIPATVRGQALASGTATPDLTAYRAVTVHRQDATAPVLTTTTDAWGSFSFTVASPGRYRCEIELSEGSVEAAFDVPADAPDKRG